MEQVMRVHEFKNIFQEDVEMEESEIEIEIPNLPRGKVISLYILSTWGDSNYVGMNGVEFWNREGKLITPNKVCSDGSLEESIDPRSNFYNIIDGMNHTQDDIHCWLRIGSGNNNADFQSELM